MEKVSHPGGVSTVIGTVLFAETQAQASNSMLGTWPQWLALLAPALALFVSWLTYRYNEAKTRRDNTFKMLDRWAADAMHKYRQAAKAWVRANDKKQIDALERELLSKAETDHFQRHEGRKLAQYVELIGRGKGIPDGVTSGQLNQVRVALDGGGAAVEEVVSGFEPEGVRQWWDEAVRDIRRSPLSEMGVLKLQLQEDNDFRGQAAAEYPNRPAYKIPMTDLLAGEDADQVGGEALLRISQFFADLGVLYSDGLLDPGLTAALFGHTLFEWDVCMTRLEWRDGGADARRHADVVVGFPQRIWAARKKHIYRLLNRILRWGG